MQKKVSVGVFTVCILLAILLSVMTTFVLTRESFVTRARTSDNSAENLAAKLTELDGRFNQHYIGETDYETAEKYVMSAYLAGTGDKYAAYYTAEEYKEMMSASYGDSEGIGVSVIYNSEYGVIQIVEIFPDSPALAAGLEIGDLIAYIGIGENRESVAEIGYDAALRIINSSLYIKSGDESLATLDVFRIDLYSGRAEFMKAGAPAAFLRRGGRVTRVDLASLPAGILQDVKFARGTAQLSQGDLVLMVSDGAVSGGDGWLEELVRSWKGTPQELCDRVVAEAENKRQDGHDDDITAAAVCIAAP